VTQPFSTPLCAARRAGIGNAVRGAAGRSRNLTGSLAGKLTTRSGHELGSRFAALTQAVLMHARVTRECWPVVLRGSSGRARASPSVISAEEG